MRILMTGVPGWLGNRFLNILLHGFENEGPVRDWKVRCLALPGQSLPADLDVSGRIEIAHADIRRIDTLQDTFRDVHLVFHLAGIIHPRNVREFYEINLNGTENVLQASIANRVKRFIQISSNSAGGACLSPDRLMTEEDKPRPYRHYGLSKYKAELAVQKAHDEGKLETVILRPCWYYGPNQPERQTTFFKMIKKGRPLVFGKGENLRSMTYLDNLCQAMLLAAEKEIANGRLYWIADERPYPTLEIYETIAELLDVKKFRPVHLPDLSSEFFSYVDRGLQGLGCYQKEIHVAGEMNDNIACSIEKAKRELGYQPKIALREGMKRSMDWCCLNGIEI